jgi:hypothetical protein
MSFQSTTLTESNLDETQSLPILAIDPGTSESALVTLLPDGTPAEGCPNAIFENDTLLSFLSESNRAICNRGGVCCDMVIERMQGMGQRVGQEVFDTVFWSGRFAQAWSGGVYLIDRRDVKVHICGHARSTDADVRGHLIMMFGGTKDVAVGRKASQGPLYGFKSHMWQALGLGVTFLHWRVMQTADDADDADDAADDDDDTADDAAANAAAAAADDDDAAADDDGRTDPPEPPDE